MKLNSFLKTLQHFFQFLAFVFLTWTCVKSVLVFTSKDAIWAKEVLWSTGLIHASIYYLLAKVIAAMRAQKLAGLPQQFQLIAILFFINFFLEAGLFVRNVTTFIELAKLLEKTFDVEAMRAVVQTEYQKQLLSLIIPWFDAPSSVLLGCLFLTLKSISRESVTFQEIVQKLRKESELVI